MEAPKSRQHPSGSSRSTTASPTRPSPRIPARRLRRLPRARSARLPRILAGGIRRGRVSVGTVSSASLEKIAALQPDLIISAEVRDGKNYEQLSAIAPTVFTQTTGPTWKDNIRVVGQALGKESLAEAKISEYETRAAAVGKEINEKANNPVISVVRFAGEPTARLYRTTSFSGIVLQDAGLKRPDNQGPDPADAGNIMMKISPELINEADADVIFISTWQDAEGKSAEAAKPFLESPLWQTLRGRKVDVDDSRWMSPVSIQAPT